MFVFLFEFEGHLLLNESRRAPSELRPPAVCVDDASKLPSVSGLCTLELVDAIALGEHQIRDAVLVRAESRNASITLCILTDVLFLGWVWRARLGLESAATQQTEVSAISFIFSQ